MSRMNRVVRGAMFGFCAVGILALPGALSAISGAGVCGSNECPDCDMVNGQTICFDKCNGDICDYKFCTTCRT
jgi:hypothetical protein